MSARLLSSDKSTQRLKYPEQVLLELWFSLSDKERSAQFIDTKTAAQRVAVSPRTIRLWIESGRVNAVQIGKKYQIHTNSLTEFITSQALHNH
jgi:excisionase family DNA binding protein